MHDDRVKKAIAAMADEAERHGADPNDDAGIVRTVVEKHGLGFNAWLCVCLELADREAQREGYRNQFDRAASHMGRR